MKFNFKLSAILGMPLVLVACSGGGIPQPEVFVSLPTAKSVDESQVQINDSRKATVSTNGGEVLSAGSGMVYKTPDGKYYAINNNNSVMRPDYSSPDKTFSTKHIMQNTDNGGKLIACCADNHRDMPAILVSESYYGAWLSPNGTVSLFSGGTLADVAYMQGGTHNPNKGKATYDVLGIRVKNGEVVNSSYTPRDTIRANSPIISRLTVNFNTGKLGGEIIGNSNFGDSIVMQDVSVNGNGFSGSAVSGSATGRVQGAFYGTRSSSAWDSNNAKFKHSGQEIGGIVNFGNPNLDAAFGGSRTAIDTQSTSSDLTPLESGTNQ